MNFYLIVFVALSAGALYEWFCQQHREKIYLVCWSLMTVCLCFRYGQGGDYVTYEAVYETIPAAIDLSQGYICGFYPEIGWRMLCALFKLLHAPFWMLTMVLGFGEMLLIHQFLKKYVELRIAGLFLLYPTLFLTYMVSGLRQGLVMCLFLGVLVPFYLEKKWIAYIIGVAVTASFHKVGYGWLILPAVYYIPLRYMMFFLGLSAAGGIFFQIKAVEHWILQRFPIYHLQQFWQWGGPSLFAIGERVATCTVILVLYAVLKRKNCRVKKQTELFLKAYLCSTCIYFLLMRNSYYSSRYAAIFKVLECAVLLALITEKKKIAKLGAVFFFGLTLVLGLKNLDAAIYEGGYDMEWINLVNYPYISVFDQDRINNYYDYSGKLERRYRDNVEDQQLWMIEE